MWRALVPFASTYQATRWPLDALGRDERFVFEDVGGEWYI
ncbi:uroporphyrinogen decarboxylase [Alicyclobacillus hesperidum URH17-3-68]|nr:uroporphyrinogen decarboxylase [Alicyclobacillus hesperidum URH17-3-68]